MSFPRYVGLQKSHKKAPPLRTIECVVSIRKRGFIHSARATKLRDIHVVLCVLRSKSLLYGDDTLAAVEAGCIVI